MTQAKGSLNCDLNLIQITPKNRKHKIDVRLTVIGSNANEISRLWGCTPQQFLYWSNSDKRNVQVKTLERMAEMLGVPFNFMERPDWENLFAPPPKWFLEAKKKEIEQKIDQEKKKTILEKMRTKQR